MFICRGPANDTSAVLQHMPDTHNCNRISRLFSLSSFVCCFKWEVRGWGGGGAVGGGGRGGSSLKMKVKIGGRFMCCPSVLLKSAFV